MGLNSEGEKQPTGQAGWKPDCVISFAKDQVSQQQSFCSEEKVRDYKEPTRLLRHWKSLLLVF